MPVVWCDNYERVGALLHAVNETESRMRRSLRTQCRAEDRTDDGADNEIEPSISKQQRGVRDRDERAGWGEAQCDAGACADEPTDHSAAIDRVACITVSIERDNVGKRVIGMHVCMDTVTLRRCLSALWINRADVQRVCTNAKG